MDIYSYFKKLFKSLYFFYSLIFFLWVIENYRIPGTVIAWGCWFFIIYFMVTLGKLCDRSN